MSTPRLEKVLGWDGNKLGPIRGLAVGKDGELFVMISNTYRGRCEVRALDRNGKYLRTILPYPANTPRERAGSLGQIEVDGERFPIINHYQSQSLAPMTGGMRRQNMAWSPRGHLVLVGAMGSAFDQGGPRHLLAMHPKGGAPDGVDFVGPRIAIPAGIRYSAGMGWNACFDHTAISPDGKWVYLTLSTWRSPHCVFRLDGARPRIGPGKDLGEHDGRIPRPDAR